MSLLDSALAVTRYLQSCSLSWSSAQSSAHPGTYAACCKSAAQSGRQSSSPVPNAASTARSSSPCKPLQASAASQRGCRCTVGWFQRCSLHQEKKHGCQQFVYHAKRSNAGTARLCGASTNSSSRRRCIWRHGAWCSNAGSSSAAEAATAFGVLDSLASPAVFAALAGIGVYQLELWLPLAKLTSTLCDAMAALCNLRCLRVRCSPPWAHTEETAQVLWMERFVDGIKCLPQLSALEVGPMFASCAQHLPASLTSLTMAVVPLPSQHAAAAEVTAMLEHITGLQSLLATSLVPLQLALPAQTTVLHAAGIIRVQLPHGLMDVSVKAKVSGHRVFAPDWRLLQDLSTQQQPWALQITAPHDVKQHALEALEACNSLTSLTVARGAPNSRTTGTPRWCRHTAKLTRLVKLIVNVRKQLQADVLRLPTLTALTSSKVGCADGVDDAVVVAFACQLTDLQDVLMGGTFQTAAIIPAIAGLKGLRTLGLNASSTDAFEACLTPSLLSQLLALSQLTSLTLPVGDACPAEARAQFAAQMTGLRHLKWLWNTPQVVVYIQAGQPLPCVWLALCLTVLLGITGQVCSMLETGHLGVHTCLGGVMH